MDSSPGSVYDSERLARAYARTRPPVHAHVIEQIRARLREHGWTNGPLATRALDVGCGAGVSTAALEPLAGLRVGLEPVWKMFKYARKVVPDAYFVVGRAEQLPFGTGSFDLLAAAGSLNYADLDLFLPEAARVLTNEGWLAIYDFSSGRRLRDDDRLDHWFSEFERRYPFAPGYGMDVTRLSFAAAGLRLETHRTFEVTIPMTSDAYLDYVLGETNVELAISNGTSEREIADWCRGTLTRVFRSEPASVIFDAYFALVGHRATT
jgi:ubiquinone/menaquinone biosynthesis C-methylase UbiE